MQIIWGYCFTTGYGLISGVGVLVYRQITKHHQKKEQEREAAEKAGHNALDGSAV